MRDTSSQQKTDSAPWEQAERLKCIIDGTNIGTWEWNVQTGETTFNERWAEIIGYRLEELAPVPSGAPRRAIDGLAETAKLWARVVPRPALTTLADHLPA